MGYRLRDGLSFCVTGNRAIFLDVAADRYFGLQPEKDLAFQRLLQGKAPGAALASLVGGGILVEDEGAAGLPQPVTVARATRELALNLDAACWKYRFAFLYAHIRAIARLRFCDFGTVVEQIERRSRAADVKATASQREWTALASSFAAATWLLPRSGQCLPRSIAFFEVLLSTGYRAKLVIGVSASPFSAHCWVQADDLVLNDRLEHIRPFEPILAI
ncbi:lasso peptide biosynthesis B2 protein (plasmid) [Sphingobium sp. V4]|uniref:lasso peptide biosynthesis B2 protein n=1 Tax=Sphingobium sp. V4 TaxID=3038927 RepID=UPI002557D198|nr:lasso peptide biosynthesis B2 protein [Sphingobium sp. V4]WIW90284.1 lasso peptide biosynthesis B2 protein [Sphingobium sp. V4]